MSNHNPRPNVYVKDIEPQVDEDFMSTTLVFVLIFLGLLVSIIYFSWQIWDASQISNVPIERVTVQP